MTMIAAWDSRVWSVIRLTIDGRWTWDQHEAVTDDIVEMMEWVRTQVDFILDIRSDYLPAGGAQPLDSASAFLRHPQAGFVVMVGPYRYNQLVNVLYSSRYPQRVMWLLCAPSVEEARTLLAERQGFLLGAGGLAARGSGLASQS
jgi:hypothetical protein